MIQSKKEIKSGISTHLLISNRLLIKAFNVPNREALRFLMVNDTKVVLPYDRALLWEWHATPTLTCASGQISVNERTGLIKKIEKFIGHIKDPDQQQFLSAESFTGGVNEWQQYASTLNKTVFWFPLKDVQPRTGLWIESWNTSPEEYYEKNNEAIEIVSSCLIPGYASAWNKFGTSWKPWKQRLNMKALYWVLGLLLLSSLLIHVPLRVIAPCEVVPRHPIVIKAPIDGIIDKISVQPGQIVKKDELLAVYNKDVPDQEFKASQKEVEIQQAELNRALTLGFQDPQSQTSIEVLTLKLEKAKVRLKQAEYQRSKLDIFAPSSGVAILQTPEEWRGRPVKVGEKILTLSDPQDTFVRIWIPESDNIPLNMEEPIHVYLNIAPEVTHLAKLTYIANESMLNETQVPSFIAEAEWLDPEQNIRLGLKGTAVLYGEKVSLFYFIFRKPIGSFRRLTGL